MRVPSTALELSPMRARIPSGLVHDRLGRLGGKGGQHRYSLYVRLRNHMNTNVGAWLDSCCK